jgi:hypothetical protein
MVNNLAGVMFASPVVFLFSWYVAQAINFFLLLHMKHSALEEIHSKVNTVLHVSQAAFCH